MIKISVHGIIHYDSEWRTDFYLDLGEIKVRSWIVGSSLLSGGNLKKKGKKYFERKKRGGRSFVDGHLLLNGKTERAYFGH